MIQWPDLNRDSVLAQTLPRTDITFMVGHADNHFITWLELKDRIGNNHKILMPAFYTNRLNAKLTLRDGWYIFAGTMTPKGADGEADYSKKWMVFVKADLL